MKKKLNILRHIIIAYAVLLAIWQLAASFSGVSSALFPSPCRVLLAFRELSVSGLSGSSSDATLSVHIRDSLLRFAAGYLLSAAAGITAGLLLGWFPRAFAYVNPVIQLLRPIAPVAWLPFLVLLVGIGDLPAVTIIFIAGFFPILLSTASAVQNIDPVYLRVAGNFGLSQRRTLTRIVFPAAFPQIAGSLHLALGTCWIFLVSGEMVGSQTGLGFLIMDAKNCLRADALLAAIITIGVIGFLLDQLIGLLERSLISVRGLGPQNSKRRS